MDANQWAPILHYLASQCSRAGAIAIAPWKDHGDAILFVRRESVRPGDTETLATRLPTIGSRSWMPVVTLSDLPARAGAPSVSASPLDRMALAFSIAKALRMAGGLVESAGAYLALGKAGDPPHAGWTFKGGGSVSRGGIRSGAAALEFLLASLVDASDTRTNDAYLIVQKSGGHTNEYAVYAVCGTTGSVLRTTTFAKLHEAVCKDQPITCNQADLEAYTETLLPRLQDACPLAAYALEHVTAEQRPYRLKLGAYSNPVRTDVWLTVGARQCSGGRGYSSHVTLSVQRALESYFLENYKRQLFFFPSCFLVASLMVAPDRVRLALPHIRAPRGSYNFVHPYVGGFERLDDMALNHESLPVGVPDAVRKVLGSRLDSHRRRNDGERDFCLENQEIAVAEIERRLLRQLGATGPFSIRNSIEDVITIARLGTTRGHQNNTSPPRASMTPEEMFYAWPESIPLPAELEGRIFTFDGRAYRSGARRVRTPFRRAPIDALPF